MSEVSKQDNQDRAPIEVIRERIGTLLTDGDVEHFGTLQEEFGNTPVWVDDPTGRYPLSRHRVSDMRVVLGHTGVLTAYFQAPDHDEHHAGRHFTLRPNNLQMIGQDLQNLTDINHE